MRKDYCFTLRKIARICKDPLRQKVFVQKNGFGNFGISCNEILFYNNTSCKVVTLIFYLNALNFPPASEVYWQVANLNERKKTTLQYMDSKNLSGCLLQTLTPIISGLEEPNRKKQFCTSLPKTHIRKYYQEYANS